MKKARSLPLGRRVASWASRRDPRLKVVWTLAFVVYAVALPDGQWGVFLLSALALWVLTLLSGVRWTAMIRRSQVALPFALAAVSTAFTWPGRPWLVLHVASKTLTLTVEGGVHFLSVLLRAWLAAQAVALLGLTTPFPQWTWALRRLGVPPELVTMMNLMYRYLFLLNQEGRRLQRAREARQVAPLPGRRAPGVRWQARVTGYLIGHLFLRSYDRAERVYQAMLARGYRGDWPLMDDQRLSKEDWILGALGVACLILIQGMVHR